MADPAAQTDPSTSEIEKEERRFLVDTAALLARPEFRRWAWHVMEDGQWCASHGCSEDVENVHQTYLAAGMRRVGVKMLVLFQQVDPRLAVRMLTEAMNLRVERAAMSPPTEAP